MSTLSSESMMQVGPPPMHEPPTAVQSTAQSSRAVPVPQLNLSQVAPPRQLSPKRCPNPLSPRLPTETIPVIRASPSIAPELVSAAGSTVRAAAEGLSVDTAVADVGQVHEKWREGGVPPSAAPRIGIIDGSSASSHKSAELSRAEETSMDQSMLSPLSQQGKLTFPPSLASLMAGASPSGGLDDSTMSQGAGLLGNAPFALTRTSSNDDAVLKLQTAVLELQSSVGDILADRQQAADLRIQERLTDAANDVQAGRLERLEAVVADFALCKSRLLDVEQRLTGSAQFESRIDSVMARLQGTIEQRLSESSAQTSDIRAQVELRFTNAFSRLEAVETRLESVEAIADRTKQVTVDELVVRQIALEKQMEKLDTDLKQWNTLHQDLFDAAVKKLEDSNDAQKHLLHWDNIHALCDNVQVQQSQQKEILCSLRETVAADKEAVDQRIDEHLQAINNFNDIADSLRQQLDAEQASFEGRIRNLEEAHTRSHQSFGSNFLDNGDHNSGLMQEVHQEIHSRSSSSAQIGTQVLTDSAGSFGMPAFQAFDQQESLDCGYHQATERHFSPNDSAFGAPNYSYEADQNGTEFQNYELRTEMSKFPHFTAVASAQNGLVRLPQLR